MQEYITEAARLAEELRNTLDSLPDLATKYATAEREYKIALSKLTLQLRQDKMPVTILQDVTRGNKTVADLRFNRDIAKELLKIAYEKINTLKLQLRIIQENSKQEWTSIK